MGYELDICLEEGGRMGAIIEVVQRFFADEDWDVSTPEDDDCVRLANYEGDNGSWRVVAIGVEEHQQVLVFTICPCMASPEHFEAAAAFLHRANWGLHIGNFELNLDDGEIRFKTSLLVDGSTLAVRQVQALVYWNCMMMDLHLPALNLLLQDGGSVDEAVQKLEDTLDAADNEGG